MSSQSPPNPPTSAGAGAATTAGVFSNPPSQQPPKPLNHNAAGTAFPPPIQREQQTFYSNANIHQSQSAAGGILYPVASSGRGFIPNNQQQSSDQNVAVPAIANFGGFPRPPVSSYPYAVHRPYGFSNSDFSVQNLPQLVRPMSAQLQQTLVDRSMGGGLVVPNVTKGVSASVNPKVVAPSSVSDGNGFKDSGEKGGDETVVIIRGRKVNISEGTSLYAQCRSWLKNGMTETTQPQHADCVMTLPKPLPASMVEKKEYDKEKEEEEEINEEDVEHLTPRELLQQHINRGKKVRARLRERRLQKIERYKPRLAMLLPPLIELQKKDNSTPGNGET